MHLFEPPIPKLKDILLFSINLANTAVLLNQELEELICTQCGLGHRDYVKNEFHILLKDKKPLAGAEWPAIVASEKSLFIDIFLHLKHGPESDESECEGDDYLQKESRSKFARDDSIYPHIRERSRRTTQSGRASLYFPTESPRQTQRSSTGGTRPETPLSTFPQTYDESYRLARRIYIPDITGSATVEYRRGSVSRVNQPDNQDEGNNNDQQPGSSDTKEISNTTFNAVKRQSLGRETSNVTFFIEEERNIVAEPDTYYSSPESEREHSQSFPSDNNTALALFDGDHGSGGIEPALNRGRPSYRRMDDARSLPHMRSPVSRSRRRSTFTEHYKDTRTRFHRDLGSQSSGFENNYPSISRRRRAVDINSTLEDERYFEPTYVPRYLRYRDTDQTLRRGYTPSLHRHNYGRSSVYGIANSTSDVASMDDAEVEADIYYIPKKKKGSIPTVNISYENRASEDSEFSRSREANKGSPERRNPEPSQRKFVLPERSSTSSRRERQSGSSNFSHPALPAKPFVLPILMWPTGPVDDPNETKDHHHPQQDNMEGPPRARNPGDIAILDQDSDASLAEVLDRVYSSLLTDKSSNHDLIFRQMEIAHRKDTVIKILKPEIPVSEATITINEPKGQTENSTNDEPQVPEYQTKLLKLSAIANSLLECFVPADYSSPVTWRYYGSIKKVIKVKQTHGLF